MVHTDPFLLVCCENGISLPSKYQTVVKSVSLSLITVQYNVAELPCAAVTLFKGRTLGETVEKIAKYYDIILYPYQRFSVVLNYL